MRQIYTPDEKIFVDYAGPTFPIYEHGKVNPKYAQIFVSVLGTSSYIYAQANWSQKLEDWIDVHVRMFTNMLLVWWKKASRARVLQIKKKCVRLWCDFWV